ncbi:MULTISPECIES: alpha/beta hydrolase family protein [unclassified Streptomyces]|uniref:alpha/beta hydrolase family protein n=1 Tax=unclassified Streptomyces TaxID=2593676 RepID=UPI003809D13F
MLPLTVRARVRAPLATAVLLLLAGCGGTGNGKAAAGATPPEDFGCLTEAQAKSGTTSYDDTEGNPVDAWLGGKGAAAVLLMHQSDGDLCQWMPQAELLAGDGYRVLVVDSNGSEVPEVVAGVALLRAKGARHVLLMGASKGGTGVLAGAVEVNPPVDAVVSLSAPEYYGVTDAASAVPRLTAPVLYMAAAGDTEFAEAGKALHKATTKAPENRLEIVGGPMHGVGMLTDDANWATVTDFLAKYAGGSGGGGAG